jgi:hypothetical protein
VCIDVFYGDVLSRRPFIKGTFSREDIFVCAPISAVLYPWAASIIECNVRQGY